MTEQITPNPADPTTGPPTDAPTPPKAKESKKVEETPKRFAAYDTTYLRFVGEVHDSKAAATKEARDRKVKAFEIREV